jgi:hypothetical protein
MTVCPSGVRSARRADSDPRRPRAPPWRGPPSARPGPESIQRREEIFHLVEDLVRIDGDEVVRAGQLDEPRAGMCSVDAVALV